MPDAGWTPEEQAAWDQLVKAKGQFGPMVMDAGAKAKFADYWSRGARVGPNGQLTWADGSNGPTGPAWPNATPGAPGAAGAQMDPRGEQASLLASLKAQAAGQGPSLAQGQLQQATDANMRHAMSLGAAQQGQGLGTQSALLNIGNQQAMIGQEAAGQSALTRSMEQMRAQQQIEQLLAGVRNQDLGLSGQNIQVDQYGQARGDRLLGGVAQGGANAITTLATQGKSGDGYPDYPAGGSSPSEWDNPYGGYAAGGMVPGDSPANDTVPAMLSPGEVVLPRSVTQAPDAAARAAAFIEAIKAQKRARGPA